MVPAQRLVLLAILPLLLAMATAVDTSLLGPMLLVDGAMAAVALIDAMLARRPLISVERTFPVVMSVGRSNPVQLHLRSIGRRAVQVILQMDLPDDIGADDLPWSKLLPARGQAEGTVHLRPTRRGAFELGDTVLRYLSPLGLWYRQQRIPSRNTIRVYPDLKAVRAYELLARQNREALMARMARLRGGENEFERLRDYQRDDAYRALDWKATARRQKLTARSYQKERDQSVMVVLDCGRLMTAESAGLSQLDHALNATLMLTHVAVRSGDQVGLMAFDDQLRRYLPPTAGPQSSQRMIRATYDLFPALVHSDHFLAFEQLSNRLRKRALVVLFTQVVDQLGAERLLRMVKGLPRRHLVICVLFRDPDIDALVEAPLTAPLHADEPDVYLRAAAAETVLWREKLARDLAAGGAFVLHTPPAQCTPSLINQYLEIKARNLL
jgi:uncharacterized protein (DUF58 family)